MRTISLQLTRRGIHVATDRYAPTDGRPFEIAGALKALEQLRDMLLADAELRAEINDSIDPSGELVSLIDDIIRQTPVE